jgi:hypothetical protein
MDTKQQHKNMEKKANDLPVDAFVVVIAVEELHLFKSGGAVDVTHNSWVHGQELVQSGGSWQQNHVIF